MHLLVTAFILAGTPWATAKSPCEKADVLEIIEASKGTRLIACGTLKKHHVDKLRVLMMTGDSPFVVFEGDEAFKHYSVRRMGRNLLLKEGLSSKHRFEPFIEIQISCDETGCKAVDSKCLWKKSKLKFDSPTSPCTARLAEQAFKASLNGDQEGLGFLIKNRCDGLAGEAIETYKMDIVRLQQLGCL